MKTYRVLIFIFSVIGLLAVLCVAFPAKGVEVAGCRLFFPSLEEVMLAGGSESVSEKMAALEAQMRLDSLRSEQKKAFEDSVAFFENIFTTHAARFHFPADDFNFFAPLFSALERAHEGDSSVHILHYGDSQIEQDRITCVIRERLQERFGGCGVGLLPVVQTVPSFSIRQSAEGDFERFTVAGAHKVSSGNSRYGVMGQYAHLSGNGTISFSLPKNKNKTPDNKSWKKVRLLTLRNAAGFSARLLTRDTAVTRKIHSASRAATETVWHLPKATRSVTLTLSGEADIAGISLEGEGGVLVDNIPFRGSSGTFFSSIDTSTLVPLMTNLNVRLIIMEFGGNMLPGLSQKNYRQFAQVMGNQIAHFQKIYPRAQVVFVGPADMSKTVDGKLQSYPLLALWVEALRETALENGAAFWDMYGVMGGHNSMINWVRERPPLAAPDYLHFTPRGANKIADMFCRSIENYYQYYKLTHAK